MFLVITVQLVVLVSLIMTVMLMETTLLDRTGVMACSCVSTIHFLYFILFHRLFGQN